MVGDGAIDDDAVEDDDGTIDALALGLATDASDGDGLGAAPPEVRPIAAATTTRTMPPTIHGSDRRAGRGDAGVVGGVVIAGAVYGLVLRSRLGG
jgi:hypothetical protein